MRIIITLFLVAVANISLAGFIPEQQRDILVKYVLKEFWGRAENSQGEFIQPASENERNTVPIATPIAYRALDAGEISGLAEWCGLNWQDHYLALTKSARSKNLNDNQVAFISFLHGAAQKIIVSAMEKNVCGEKERAKTQVMLNESKAKGLNGT